MVDSNERKQLDIYTAPYMSLCAGTDRLFPHMFPYIKVTTLL